MILHKFTDRGCEHNGGLYPTQSWLQVRVQALLSMQQSRSPVTLGRQAPDALQLPLGWARWWEVPSRALPG